MVFFSSFTHFSSFFSFFSFKGKENTERAEGRGERGTGNRCDVAAEPGARPASNRTATKSGEKHPARIEHPRGQVPSLGTCHLREEEEEEEGQVGIAEDASVEKQWRCPGRQREGRGEVGNREGVQRGCRGAQRGRCR